MQLFSDHQALEPLLKRNKVNNQYSTRLTRLPDRLTHLDISLKLTAGELGEVPYQTNNNKKKFTKNRSLILEKTTKTTERSEKENHRKIQKDKEEIRSIRFNGEKINKFLPDHSGGRM